MAFYAPRQKRLIGPFIALILLLAAVRATAQDDHQARWIQWIWSPTQQANEVPKGQCFFRKTFYLGDPEEGKIQITCDDAYQLYINGRQVGSGDDWKSLETYDIKRYLLSGKNVVAVRATNKTAGSAALMARLVVKQQGHTHVDYSTDPTWKTNLDLVPHWEKPSFVDSQWAAAQSFGSFGKTLPWGEQVRMTEEFGRFRTAPEFSVEWVIAPEDTGSLIAMTFDHRGRIIASREDGPLIIASDTNHDGVHDTVETYCDEVKNCQGLVALNGHLLVTGDGPQGAGLYRLSDNDQNGNAEQVVSLLKFKGDMREHGPHGIVLGPDGLVYIVVGNHSALAGPYANSSPYCNSYEGDLLHPKYEDPGGHAVGITHPAGVILRTDSAGTFVELVSGGLRNPYDLAFNRQGDLFVYDADMEWDRGTPWYRPTRICHITPGAEFGWRSGWSKWPECYLDSLPATLNMGPGSPTGVVFYNHVMYPVRYHNAMFACDWSRGRIHAIRLHESQGTYAGKAQVFLEGRPLNATDLEVGPDGWLYFCTGGRGTSGGIYRIIWNGKIPPAVTKTGRGIERAIKQPQPESAWSHYQFKRLQSRLGDLWKDQLSAIARNTRRTPDERMRALILLEWFGPLPSESLLLEVSHDPVVRLRTKAAYLMGIRGRDAPVARLISLLEDSHPTVRRTACESLVRAAHRAPVDKILTLLADPQRHVSYAARRALEKIPIQQWKDPILGTSRVRQFLQGSTALLIAEPTKEHALAVVDRSSQFLNGEVHDPELPAGFLSDQDFTDLLRVIQLALLQGNLKGNATAQISRQLALEYPSRDETMNRELLRILSYLDEPSIVQRLTKQLASDASASEKFHLAMHSPRFQQGWKTSEKLELLRFYRQLREMKGGKSRGPYIDLAIRDFVKNLTDSERAQVLTRGTEWPSAALAAMATLSPKPRKAILRQIRQLDGQLTGLKSEPVERLRTGIIAILGRSRDENAMAYLRELYEKNSDRREEITVGLAQDPEGENWPLLIRSLPLLDGLRAHEVLKQLHQVDRRPQKPEPLRQVILAGLRDPDNCAPVAVQLLEKWTGEQIATKKTTGEKGLLAWQDWFVRTYPDHAEPRLPVDSNESKWTYEELLSFLQSPEATTGNALRGAVVFQRAQCARCHRYGNQGDRVGPDLTTVSHRFHQKEILESILFPSHVISDQYASKIVMTADGKSVSGMVTTTDGSCVVVLKANGEQIKIDKEDIDEMVSNRTSAMPEGLLDTLTLEDIADLFAYLGGLPRTNVTSRREAKNR